MEKKTSNFLGELEQTVDEIYKNWPPRIELHGWWWKKYIPHFKRQRDAMQAIIDHQWDNGMAEELSDRMAQIVKEEIMNHKKYGEKFGL